MKENALRTTALFLLFTLLFPARIAAQPIEPDGTAAELSEKFAYLAEADLFAEPDISETARQAELPEPGTYCEGELLVKMERSVSLQSDGSAFPDYVQDCAFLFSVENGENALRLQSENAGDCAWYRLTLREGTNFLSAWREIETLENVVFVQPNYLYTAQDTTENIMDADPYIHAQTWLDRISAVDAWEQGANIGEGVVVAVLDSGVDLDHPDLAGNLVTGYDFVDNDSVPDDENGHGTHVAGIIAACNNALGVRGVAYGAKIMPVRVLGANGGGSSDTISEGIRYAAENGANIINLSLGGIGRDQMEAEAIKTARGMGCLVVAAAGNSNLPTTLSDGETYGGVFCSPAGLPGVLTVMAADEEGELASFSNYDTDPDAGAEYEIMAPGVSILSTTMGGGYGYMDGTSMACPVVAGAAAVLMGMGCDADSAFQIIASCAEADAGRVDYQYPLLDLAECVEQAKKSTEYNTAPNITGITLNAPVQNLRSTGDDPVSFSKLNTSSALYFHDDALWSVPKLVFENIGGGGEVTISGSVGGISVGETLEVKLGERVELPLTLSGTPAITNGTVEIDLQIGEECYHSFWNAYRLRFLADEPGFTKNGAGQLVQTETSVLLHGDAETGTIWVQDANLIIPAGCNLTLQWQLNEKGIVLYQAPFVGIYCQADAQMTVFGQFDCYGATLMGDLWFTVDSDLGFFYYCTIYDPWVTWIGSCGNCRFFGTQAMSDMKKVLSGYRFELCGIYDCSNLDLWGSYFWANMISCCANSVMTVGSNAVSNTFIENFSMGDAQSVLKVKTVNVEPYTDGLCAFRHNSVVGPLLLRDLNDMECATCSSVYHQSVAPELLPEGVTDAVVCAPDSTVGETIEDYWEFGCGDFCPLFALDLKNTYYVAGPGRVNYLYEIMCSADISEYAWPTFFSFTDPLADAAKAWLNESYSDDVCFVYGSMILNDLKMRHLGSLGDVYRATVIEEFDDGSTTARDYSATALRGQTLMSEFEFWSTALDRVSGEQTEDGYTITWEDEMLEEGDCAEISVSVNGGEETPLGTVEDACQVHSFTDPTEYGADTTVCYTVEIYRDGEGYKSGTATYLISLPDADQGVDLQLGAFYAQDSNTLSLRTAGKVVIDDCLSFRFPGLDATSVTFGEQVAASGIAYGAASDAEGTTVYLGSGDSAILDGGETLFTLGVTGADGEITVSATNGDAEQDWGQMDSAVYTSTGDLRIAQDSSGEVRQLWSGGNIFLARYDADGKLLGIEKLSGAYTMERPQSGRETVFCLSDGLIPQGEPITSGGIS